MKIIMDDNERINEEGINGVLEQLKAKAVSKGAVIKSLFAGGLSVKEISNLTGIRYNHVYNVCKNEVLRNNMESDISTAREGGTKKEQILGMLADGKTATEISRELGCLYNQVWQVAKAAGLTKKQQSEAQEA